MSNLIIHVVEEAESSIALLEKEYQQKVDNIDAELKNKLKEYQEQLGSRLQADITRLKDRLDSEFQETVTETTNEITEYEQVLRQKYSESLIQLIKKGVEEVLQVHGNR